MILNLNEKVLLKEYKIIRLNIQQRENKKNKVNWIWKNIFFPHTDRQYHILIIAIGEITWNAICVFSTISIQATFSKNLCV